MNRRIVFIHSLNNFTGSPNVLSIIIREFVARGYQVDLITNKSQGFLSGIENVNYHYTSYRWCKSKILTFLLLLYSQLEMFFMILKKFRKANGLFYINTVIPFGAAWACHLLNKKLVYHVHENMALSKPMYPLYRFTYNFCKQKTIFVSAYLQNAAGKQANSTVIYNSLSADFLNKVKAGKTNGAQSSQRILMVCSLRAFKGVYEFIELSKRLPQFSFELVISATQAEVEELATATNAPSNLSLFSQQTDLHPFYQRAKILLQLSHPKVWVETFGLTILEAMVYGVPSIVPNVGGPTELIEDGVNGFTIDPLDMQTLISSVKLLMEDEMLYNKFSKAAIEKSRLFEQDLMINTIEKYIIE